MVFLILQGARGVFDCKRVQLIVW